MTGFFLHLTAFRSRFQVIYLSQYFLGYDNEQQDAIYNKLLAIYKNTNIKEDTLKNIRIYFDNLGNESLTSKMGNTLINNLFNEISKHYNDENYLKMLFPIVPRTINFSSLDEFGSMIQTLLSQTKNNIDIFSWIHGQMVNSWPNYDAEVDSYDPEQIFDEARTIAMDNPDNKQMGEILLSLDSMYKNKVVHSENEILLAELALTLWPYHIEISSRVIKTLKQIPNDIDLIVSLADIELENEMDTRLVEIWAYISTLLPEESIIHVTVKILENYNDDVLKLWIRAQKEKGFNTLESTIIKCNNDANRKRLWNQIIAIKDELKVESFRIVIPKLFALEDSPETLQAIISNQDVINSLIKNNQDRIKLQLILYSAYQMTMIPENKDALLKWIKNIGGSITNLKKLFKLSKKEIEVLKIPSTNFRTFAKFRRIFEQSKYETGVTSEDIINKDTPKE